MILVTGGTGLVGSHLLEQLISSGKKVRAIRRKSSQNIFSENFSEKIEWVEGDVLDITSLKDAMQGVEQVYHCAGVVSFSPNEKNNIMKVNVDGTANMVNIALENKIKKMVQVSSMAALGRTEHQQLIDENTQWEESKLNSNYAISKRLGEMEMWRGMTEGLNGVIVNPSVILGAGDWANGALRFFGRVKKGMPFYSTHTTGFVDVRDVAKTMIALMESNISNERFIITAENWSYQQLFNEIADNFGMKRPSVKISPLLSSLAWRLEKIRKMITGGTPLVTRETARTVLNSFLYSNAKIKNALNYEFIPMKQTIKETCEQFLQEIN